MEQKPLYITTTLPYVNSKPHIGFALEIVQADAVARAARLAGREVFFNTGTDEHGQKIYQQAQEEKQDVQEYVDKYAKTFEALKEPLNLSFDHFIRTTDAHHVHAAQEMWRRCEAAGDIYKKHYKVRYCVGCELEKSDSELEHGHCPIHPNLELQIIEEENYFFRFSKYQDALKKYLETGTPIIPEIRKQNALQFIEKGLEDFSVSRIKEKMSWGIPVPGDDTQVMYVWFDALTNYVSTTGWPEEGGDFAKFWRDGETLQMAGKDQVRMQSLMWQAMLMSAGIPTTDRVFYHGFVTSGGQKMSKSLGNVIDPMQYVGEFGTDALRYFLLRHIHATEDADFTRERFIEDYNANLANGLGNLASRIMKMAEDNLPKPAEIPERDNLERLFAAFDAYDFNGACDLVWEEIARLDARIQETQPFKVVKEDPEKGCMLIEELAVGLYRIGRMLQPIMPATSDAIKAAVKANKKPENLFLRVE